MPGCNVRMMIQFGYHNLIAAAVLSSERSCQVECKRGHVCAKRNFFSRSIQKISTLQPGILNRGVGFFARRVGPMRVCVMVVKIVGHCLNHLSGNLGSAGSVEIGNRMLIVKTVERGEASSYVGNRS